MVNKIYKWRDPENNFHPLPDDKKECSLFLWGGFFNEVYKVQHGYAEGVYFFESYAWAAAFLDKLKKIEKALAAWHLAATFHEGWYVRYRTIARMVFVYNGKEFPYEDDYERFLDPDVVVYAYRDGNNSCDCNRSLFIRRKYGENAVPELECNSGENLIRIKNFEIILRRPDGKEQSYTPEF